MTSHMEFPKGFLFGASTSAYQIEGAYDEDGKGRSIYDCYTHRSPKLPNGDIACDSYHKYKEDIKLLKDAGFKVYRFSISWPRILPTGEFYPGNVNEAGVHHYRRVLKELIDNGIEPMVTIYHWDLPQYIEENYGGWTNSVIIDIMVDYADLLFDLFGDLVKRWITINEPIIMLQGYTASKVFKLAPGKDIPSPGDYIIIHNMIRTHAAIYRLYDKKYRAEQKGKIAISLVGSCCRPKDPNNPADIDATNTANQFLLGIFANPIFTEKGDYPELVRQIVDKNSAKEGRKRSRLPYFTEEEKESLIGSADFFAVNHYVTQTCTSRTPQNRVYLAKDSEHPNHANSFAFFPVDLDVSMESSRSDPTGIRDAVKYIKENYGDPEIFVTENGFGYIETEEKPEPLKDIDRINYFTGFLTELWKAINVDKCNVVGYSIWTLLDNFEWNTYATKMGIVHVNFDDDERPRTKKESFEFFRKLLKSGVIPTFRDMGLLSETVNDCF